MLNVTVSVTCTQTIKKKLKDILNTVIGNTNTTDDSTFISPDRFDTRYPNEGQSLITSYNIMMLNNSCSNVTDIWTNHAPCPACVKSLIKHYADCAHKPTIHIARLLNVSGSQDYNLVTETLQGLAKLANCNFMIRAWDMEEFKAPYTTSESTNDCGNVIQNYTQNDKFTVALLRMDRYIEHVNKIKPSNASCTGS